MQQCCFCFQLHVDPDADFSVAETDCSGIFGVTERKSAFCKCFIVRCYITKVPYCMGQSRFHVVLGQVLGTRECPVFCSKTRWLALMPPFESVLIICQSLENYF